MTLNELFLGSALITIDSIDPEAFCNKLRDACRIISLSICNEQITAKVYYAELKKAVKLLDSECCVYSVRECRGVIYHLSRYSGRYGILLGVLLAIVITAYMSNIAMKIEINCEYADEKLINNVLAVLDTEGVHPGTFLPSLNCLKIEAAIFDMFDDISWVSVGSEGSKVIVNLMLAPEKADYQTKRIPSNIVATRDGVIVDAKVLAGELSVLIGDAVAENDLLVSGIVERRNDVAYYYHSIAEIIAEFEQEYLITQNYIDTTQIYGESVYKTHLKFYDYILGSDESPYENFTAETYEQPLKLFGIELPISICRYKLTEINEDIKVYDRDSAANEAHRKLDILENELLEQYEIIDRKIMFTYDENGVMITANYKLRGDIGRQQYIFAE